MGSNTYVKLGRLIDEMNLEVLRAAPGYRDVKIFTENVNRPALQLTGFFDYFDPTWLQIIGKVETTYLNKRTAEERAKRFDAFFSYNMPALIITRNIEPFPECMAAAEKYNRTVLRSQDTSAALMGGLIDKLRHYLSPTITRHGVLLEVYGEGVLLLGESGVGKSETAIELVQRGHRLVADDAVDIKIVNGQLVGSAPELIRHYIELRGIGVVDVRSIFGMRAVRDEQVIDLVINLEPWDESVFYDRMGADERTTSILELDVPVMTIPVKPGRNLASIVEVAAMNNRNKKMGYNAAKEFEKKLDAHFEQVMSEQDTEHQAEV